MRKKIASGAIVPLKEALTYLYWYKSDLRSFLTSCLRDARILSTLDWSDYKRNIIANLIDRMDRNQDIFQPDLLRLMSEVACVRDFSHLERLEDGELKADRAKIAISALREYLFKKGMTVKVRMLMSIVGMLLGRLEKPDDMIDTIQKLAKRHIEMGITEEQYETLESALIWTMAHSLGRDFTPEVEEAWREAYRELTTVIKEASLEVA